MPRGRPKKADVTEHYAKLSLDDIYEPADPMRLQISEKSIEELARSFMTVGQLQAVLVRPQGKKYEIVHGHRRFLAAKRAKIAQLKCVVREMKDAEVYFARALENIDREDTTPYEDALYLARMTEQLKMTGKQVAEKLGKSPAWVSQRLAILNYAEPLKEALKEQHISFSVARALSKITQLDDLRVYITYAVDSGATPAVAQRWADDWASARHSRSNSGIEAPVEFPNSEPINPGAQCNICDQHKTFSELKSKWLCGSCWTLAIEAIMQMSQASEEASG